MTEIEIEEILFMTDKAFKVSVHDTEIWIPKSVVYDEVSYNVGDRNVVMSIKDWFVEKMEL